MNQGLIIGGILPAVIFGFTGILARLASERGIAAPAYVFWIGVGFILSALLAYPIFKTYDWNFNSALISIVIGIAQAVGMAMVFYAIMVLSTPLSQLVPLYNTNTLVAVLLSLVIFSEWKDVDVAKLMLGATLIVVGSYFVTVAK